MKPASLFTLLLLFVSTLSFAQKDKREDADLYPTIYSFEKAREHEQKGAYEKAIWFYINLYPNNKAEVAMQVKALTLKLDTTDIARLIKKTFARYAPFDPMMSSFDKNGLNLDAGKVRIKGQWADELILAVTDPNKLLATADEYNKRSITKFKAKDYPGAIADLDRAIEKEPTGQYYFNRAYTKSMMNDCAASIPDFDKTIELKYRLADAYFERGFCKEAAGDTAGAMTDYKSAVKKDNKQAKAYGNMGVMHYKQQNYPAAITDFNAAISADSNYIEAYFNRAFVRKDFNDLKGACEDWEKALSMGFEDAQAYITKFCK